ncbi:MAG TPA: hypothetical protein VEX62_03060 [Candidatus Limnocylindrales bacterium]|nr:hypothetical protein [Candidatus Limnocylindrales bacterium]
MALVTGLIAVVGRFASQILNLTLGWATLLLFGKVPQHKQLVLLLIVFGSLAWVALLVGIVIPDVGTFLIALVPAPDFIEENWIRLAMVLGAVIVPLGIGAAAVFVTAAENRPQGPIATAKAILRGYPFALVLSVILAVLVVVATFRKLRSIARRWEDAHVPMIVKPGRYDELFGSLHAALSDAGLELAARDAGVLISGPPKLLDLVAGRALGDLVPDTLRLLAGPALEILVYPSDLAISGKRIEVARARAVITSKLADAPAYLTTTAESQRFEDELERLGVGAAERRPEQVLRHVHALDERLARLAVPYEEWETLYRLRLQLERDALVALTGTGSRPGPMKATQMAVEKSEPRQAGSRLQLAGGLAGLALIAADLVVLLSDRRRRGEKRSNE